MSIGDRIRSLRGKRSLAELGKELEVSATQLSRIETDQSKPSIELAGKICDLYGVSLDWLFGRSDEKDPDQKNKTNDAGQEDTITVSKDEFIELQRLALSKAKEKSEILEDEKAKLKAQLKELKNH